VPYASVPCELKCFVSIPVKTLPCGLGCGQVIDSAMGRNICLLRPSTTLNLRLRYGSIIRSLATTSGYENTSPGMRQSVRVASVFWIVRGATRWPALICLRAIFSFSARSIERNSAISPPRPGLTRARSSPCGRYGPPDG